MEWKFIQQVHKPYIVPTFYGLAYALLIMNIFALGYFRSNAPFHTVGLTLIILGLVAMVHSNSNIQWVRMTGRGRFFAEEGQDFSVPLEAKNLGTDSRYNILIDAPKHLTGSLSRALPELRTSELLTLSLQKKHRGIYALDRIRVASRGIFGLFYAWKWAPVDIELIVYPKPRGDAPLPIAPEEQGQEPRPGDEFVGHRNFQSGFPMKRIDWKAFARSERLLVKEFQELMAQPIVISFQDASDSDTERTLQQLCAWVLQAAREGRPFRLILPHNSLAMGSGQEHLEAALTLLAAHSETFS